MKKIKDWLLDKWLAGFFNALIAFSLKIIWDMKPEERGSLISFNWFWNLIKKEFPLWLLLIALAVFVIFHKIQIGLQKRVQAFAQPPKPDFLKYTRDVFGQRREEWSWRYGERYGEFQIADLLPLCPFCKTESDYHDSGILPFHVTCPKCRLDGRNHFFQSFSRKDDVEREIIRRVKSGEYKSVINHP